MDIRNKTKYNHSTLQWRSQPKYKKSHNIKTGETEVKKIMCRWCNCLCRKAKRIYRNIIRITNFSRVAGYKNKL